MAGMSSDMETKPVPQVPREPAPPPAFAPIAWLEGRIPSFAVAIFLGVVVGALFGIFTDITRVLYSSWGVTVDDVLAGAVKAGSYALLAWFAAAAFRRRPRISAAVFLAVGFLLQHATHTLNYALFRSSVYYWITNMAFLVGCAALVRSVIGPTVARYLPRRTGLAPLRLLLTGLAYMAVAFVSVRYYYVVLDPNFSWWSAKLMTGFLYEGLFVVLAIAYPLEYSAPARERRLLEEKKS